MITLSWLKHLSGKVVRVMLDYVDRVKICRKLEAVLKEQELWPDISLILSKYLVFTFEMMNKVLGVGPLCYYYFVFFISDWCFS